MTRTRYLLPGIALAVVIGVSCILFATRSRWQGSPQPAEQPGDASDLSEMVEFQSRIRSLYRPKGPTQPGDWLSKYAEAGESFQEYVASRRGRRVCDEHTTIYLVPLGEFTPAEEKVLEDTQDCMERFFAMPVKVLERVPLADLPAHAHRTHPTWGDKQTLTAYLMDDVLLPRRPDDAVAVLGLTAGDLWTGEGNNFVFGQASLDRRVGVWSLYRYGNPAEGPEAHRRYLHRTIQTAVHETGHMLGIPHCIAYECGMNGSNSLRESDGQPLEFCPECQAKIWWTCRAEELADYAQIHGLVQEESHWQDVLECLKMR